MPQSHYYFSFFYDFLLLIRTLLPSFFSLLPKRNNIKPSILQLNSTAIWQLLSENQFREFCLPHAEDGDQWRYVKAQHDHGTALIALGVFCSPGMWGEGSHLINGG